MSEPALLTEIAGGESQYREFKRLVDNPESVAGEIVALANSAGGAVYFGVADDGQIVGLPDADKTFQTLTHICRDRCIPPVSPVLEQYTHAGKIILVLRVKPELNRQKPYRTAGGRFYIRVGKDKQDATGRELVRIAQAAGELHYDESPVLGTGLATRLCRLSRPIMNGNSACHWTHIWSKAGWICRCCYATYAWRTTWMARSR